MFLSKSWKEGDIGALVGVAVGVAAGLFVGSAVGVDIGVLAGVAVGVNVGVFVEVAVGVGVSVAVRVDEGLGVGVGATTVNVTDLVVVASPLITHTSTVSRPGVSGAV